MGASAERLVATKVESRNFLHLELWNRGLTTTVAVRSPNTQIYDEKEFNRP